jgi:hypothetical protein
MLSLGRTTVSAAFPADGDTFEYDFAVNITGVNTTGPNYSESYTFDMGVDFINSTGDYYWANHTITYPDEDVWYPYNGTTTGMGVCHYHPDNEAPLMFNVFQSNWSLLADYWSSDYMFIEGGTQPGDELVFGYGDTYDSSMWYDGFSWWDEDPYADPYATWYQQYTLPVGPGTPLAVNGGAVTLSTVMVGMDYEQHYNSSNPTYSMWDMTAAFNVSWEWSLGFLAQVQFDIYMNLNPNKPFMPFGINLTRMDIEGGITLVNAELTDPVQPGPWEMPPAIPGFPIEAVLMGLFAALIPVTLLRKRRK